jgi:hypothetical protein
VHAHDDLGHEHHGHVQPLGRIIPSLLKTLDPKARENLHRVLVNDLLDFLVLHTEERRKALQLLGELEAVEQR